MALTHDAVLRLIRAEITAQLALAGADPSRCSIVDEAGTQLSSDLMIQVKPLGRINELPNVGIGLVTERIEVTTWVREMKDPAGKATLAIAGADNRSLLRKVGIALTALDGNTLDDSLVVPLRFLSSGAVRRDDRAPGFIGQGKVFSYTFEPDNTPGGTDSQVWMGWSATAPASLDDLETVIMGRDSEITRGDDDSEYIWALAVWTDLVFRTSLGVQPFYSPAGEPPTAPFCGTVTIDGILYRRWRSPYATTAESATFRVTRT